MRLFPEMKKPVSQPTSIPQSSTLSPADYLAHVQLSPLLIQQKDRTGWLNLFTASAVICDPYGSAPIIGRQRIAQFYDAFIAPTTIEFSEINDYAYGSTVYRDLIITITMGTATVATPAHLEYQLQENSAGAPQIAKLHAYWEVPQLSKQLLALGKPGVAALSSRTKSMTQHLGLSGLLGFSKGFYRLGERHKRFVSHALLKHLTTLSDPPLEPKTIQLVRIIAAGDTISASLTINGNKYLAFVQCTYLRPKITSLQLLTPNDHYRISNR